MNKQKSRNLKSPAAFLEIISQTIKLKFGVILKFSQSQTFNKLLAA